MFAVRAAMRPKTAAALSCGSIRCATKAAASLSSDAP
jgi:hypothetical protein